MHHLGRTSKTNKAHGHKTILFSNHSPPLNHLPSWSKKEKKNVTFAGDKSNNFTCMLHTCRERKLRPINMRILYCASLIQLVLLWNSDELNLHQPLTSNIALVCKEYVHIVNISQPEPIIPFKHKKKGWDPCIIQIHYQTSNLVFDQPRLLIAALNLLNYFCFLFLFSFLFCSHSW